MKTTRPFHDHETRDAWPHRVRDEMIRLMSFDPERERSWLVGIPSGSPVAVFYWPEDLSCCQHALTLNQVLGGDGSSPDMKAFARDGDGRETLGYRGAVFMLPCDELHPDVDGAVGVVERYLRTYRSRRAFEAPTDSRRVTGVALVAGPAALLGAPLVLSRLVGVDGWIDVQDIGPGVHLISSRTPLSDRVGQQPVRGPVRAGGRVEEHSPSEQMRRELLTDAWATVRRAGLKTRRDCLIFHDIVAEQIEHYNNPRFNVLHRPLGSALEMNALEIVIAGLQNELKFSRKSQMESLSRALRPVIERVQKQLPDFKMPYHAQQPFGQVYRAVRLILRMNKGGRPRPRRHS